MNLSDSRSGRAIKAVRDNKIAAETVGINISKYRLLAFTISAALAGLAGVLYSHNLGMLQSSKFDFNTSINVLVMVVLGGMGNIPGSIIAAVVLTVLPEEMRFLQDYRMIIYAVVLIVLMVFTWNPKCIEFRKMVSAKIKSLLAKLKAKLFKKTKSEEVQ
jgi:branched-chain amino acid transport system permease protein